MSFLTRSLRAKTLAVFALVSLVLLAACGNGPSSTGSGGSGSGSSSKTVTVGSKLDPEAQLLGEMYVLLLTKAGYKVTPRLALGQTPTLDAALKSGAIDIYPEFTATGLNIIKAHSSFDPQKDYDTVKAAYESQFKITWLDYSPLNDGYALCTSQAQSSKLGVKTLSDLAPKVKDLTLATQSDGVTFIDGLKTQYGFTTSSFKAVKKVDYAIGFSAIKSGDAAVTECYTTDGSVTTGGDVFLIDDKHGFPEFHPAPLVRDAVLQANPDIKDILNKLAPKLTTDVSIQLQGQVSTAKKAGTSVAQAVKQVAQKFLQDQGLL
ncbi:MAG: glycine betaine ABC transporter substrate-binding protein [Ktedonobacteraceae bacterium]